MQVKRVGTIKEGLDGTLDIRYWVIDDCDLFNMTKAEEQELIDLAKKNGTYSTDKSVAINRLHKQLIEKFVGKE